MSDYERGRADERAAILAMIDGYKMSELKTAKAIGKDADVPDYREAMDRSIRAGAAWTIAAAIQNNIHQPEGE